MTGTATHELAAAELDAAAHAYQRALDGPTAEAEAEAGERLKLAIQATTALLRAAPVAPEDPAAALRPGDPVLWLNAALAAHRHDIGPYMSGTVRDEAYPDSTATASERAERWYVVEITDRSWYDPEERIVCASQLIALPSVQATGARRAG